MKGPVNGGRRATSASRMRRRRDGEEERCATPDSPKIEGALGARLGGCVWRL
jgi:hypothetical protein